MVEKIIYTLFISAFIWIMTTSGAYRFKHPEMTETQLFLKLPDAILLK